MIYSYFKKYIFLFFFLGAILLVGINVYLKKIGKPADYQHKVEKIANNYKLPQSISFCGERVPIENQFVWELLDREFILEVWDRRQVVLWFKRAGYFFPFFEEKLRKAGLPDDLKYISVIESALIPDIGSHQGAKGLWQFMRKTAKAYGLRVDNTLDERRCYRSATIAAFEYLKKLHDNFGSWSLALAAYNCGGTQLSRKIREQKTNDYYNLLLPRETERFVYRIVACKVILENLNKYGFNLDEDERYKPYDLDFIPLNVSNSIRIRDLSQAIGLSEKLFYHYNPQLTGSYLPYHEYSIYIPKKIGKTFRRALDSLSKNSAKISLEDGVYIVKPGDSLSRISKVTGVSLYKLKKINKIYGTRIEIGQKLKLK